MFFLCVNKSVHVYGWVGSLFVLYGCYCGFD